MKRHDLLQPMRSCASCAVGKAGLCKKKQQIPCIQYVRSAYAPGYSR